MIASMLAKRTMRSAFSLMGRDDYDVDALMAG